MSVIYSYVFCFVFTPHSENQELQRREMVESGVVRSLAAKFARAESEVQQQQQQQQQQLHETPKPAQQQGRSISDWKRK